MSGQAGFALGTPFDCALSEGNSDEDIYCWLWGEGVVFRNLPSGFLRDAFADSSYWS